MSNDKIVPKFINYYRDNFQGSLRVNRRLDWLQRHIYKALCLEACFCATRPYLPDDDAELAILADVPDEVWMKNRDAVLKMFTKTDEGYTHPRILSEWEKASASYGRMAELSKLGVEARRKQAKAVEPTLDDVPDGDRTVTSIAKHSLNEHSLNKHREDIEVDDSLRSKQVSNESATSTKSKSQTLKANDATSIDATNISPSGADAVELVKTLHFLLSQRKDVKIPVNYAKFWLRDFESALTKYSFKQVLEAVIFSQLPRNQMYFIRAEGILKSLQSLVEQCEEPRNQKSLWALWDQAVKGKLPPPKKEKSMTDAFKDEPKTEDNIQASCECAAYPEDCCKVCGACSEHCDCPKREKGFEIEEGI